MKRETRTRADSTCPACNGPDRVVEFRFLMDDGQTTEWKVDGGECAGRCWEQDLDRYNEARARQAN